MKRLLLATLSLLPLAAAAQSTYPSTGRTGAAAANGDPLKPSEHKAAAAAKCDLNVSGCAVTPPGSFQPFTMASLYYRSKSIRDIPGIDCTGTSDSSIALAAATLSLANTGTKIDVDGGCSLRLGGLAQVLLRGVAIEGPYTRETETTSLTYGQQGGTFSITGTASSPFLMSDGWALRGLKFYWPAQTEAAAEANAGQPIAFPPLLSVNGTDEVYSWSFERNQVINAYDIADFTGSPDAGHGHWEGNQEFALRYHYVVHRQGGETWIVKNQYSFVADYMDATSGTRALLAYAAANAEALHITGTGTTSAYDAQSVDGLRMSNNYALAMRYFVHVAGGTINLATLTDNGVDQVQTLFAVDNGGAALATKLRGGSALCQPFLTPAVPIAPPVAPCVTVKGGAPHQELSLDDLNIETSSGPAVVFVSTNGGYLRVTGGIEENIGNGQIGLIPYNGIEFDSAYGDLSVVGAHSGSSMANQTVGAKAVVVDAARTHVISSSTFSNWYQAVQYNQAGSVGSLVGNVSLGTSGPVTVDGPGIGSVSRIGNAWDVGPRDPAQDFFYLWATTASTVATRMTVDGQAPNTYNTVNLPNREVCQLKMTAVMQDIQTYAGYAAVDYPFFLLTTGTAPANTGWNNVTAPTSTAAGSGSPGSLALAADTTNQGLSATFTAPNADMWKAVLKGTKTCAP